MWNRYIFRSCQCSVWLSLTKEPNALQYYGSQRKEYCNTKRCEVQGKNLQIPLKGFSSVGCIFNSKLFGELIDLPKVISNCNSLTFLIKNCASSKYLEESYQTKP